MLAEGLAGSRSSTEVATAVLLDGLERENALLRQQLDRCFARERALRAEADEVRAQLESQDRLGQYQRQVETASMAAAAQRQGEMAEAVQSRLEALRGENDTQDQRLAHLRAEVAGAQQEAQAVVSDLEALQQFVLPGTPSEEPAGSGPGTAYFGLGEEAPELKAIVQRARRTVGRLRLACEAKLETLRQVHEQLRFRLEEAASMPTPSARGSFHGHFTSHAASGALMAATDAAAGGHLDICGLCGMCSADRAAASAATAGARANVELEARLRGELQEARDVAKEEQTLAEEASHRCDEQEEQQLRVTRELHEARRELRVREVEVRELQLLGKFFVGRSKALTQEDFDVAAVAEEFRKRCSRQEEELDRLRAELDLLRVERARTERRGSSTALAGMAPPAASLVAAPRRALSAERRGVSTDSCGAAAASLGASLRLASSTGWGRADYAATHRMLGAQSQN